MIRLIVILAFFAISLNVYSDTFTIEDDNLRDLGSEFSDEIKKNKEFSIFRSLNCKLQGKAISLSASEDESVYLYTTKNACGWGASTGPIWLIWKKKGILKIIFYNGGYSLTKKNITSSGLHSFSLNSSFSGKSVEKNFSFDGFTYKEYDETQGLRHD